MLVALYSILAVQLGHFADDPGVGWHLKTGKVIAEQMSVPTTDPFLASASPRPWIASQWLGDLIIWRLYSLGSWPLVYASLTSLYALFYLGVLYVGISRITGRWLFSSIALIVAFKVGQVHFLLRPVVFSLVIFALLYVVLSSWVQRCRSGEQLPRKIFWLIALLFLIWSNVHPEFVMGLALLAIVSPALWLESKLKKDPHAHKVALNFLALFAVCIVATFCNPRGWSLYQEIFSYQKLFSVDGNFIARQFSEWQPLSFGSSEGGLVLFSFAVLFLGAISSRGDSQAWGCFDVISLLVFGCLGCSALRLAPYYAIIATIPMVRALQAIGGSSVLRLVPNYSWYQAKLLSLEGREQRSSGGIPLLTVLLSLILIDAAINQRLLIFRGPFGPNASDFPYGAVEALRETATDEKLLTVAAPLQWGGFITFFADGVARPLLDDRAPVVPAKLYEDFFKSMRVGANWKNFLARHEVTHILLKATDPLAIWLKESGDALVLYEDSVAILFDARSVL